MMVEDGNGERDGRKVPVPSLSRWRVLVGMNVRIGTGLQKDLGGR